MAPELPVEIIELCFSFLDTRDKPTCAAACLTSKFYSRKATHKLYGDVGFNSSHPYAGDRVRRLRLLTRTLIERPDLRDNVRIVRHFFDRATHMPPDEWEDWVTTFVRILYDSLPHSRRTRRSNLFAVLTSAWAFHFPKTGHAEAYAFYILLCCPKVDILDITGDASQMIDLGYLSYLLHDGPEHLQDTNQPIPELEVREGLHSIMELHLDHDTAPQGYSFTIDSVSRVLNSFMLTILEVEGLEPVTSRIDDFSDIESGVMTIRLTNCWAPAKDIAVLLRACPELQTLITEWMYVPEHQDWQALAEGLKQCPWLDYLSIVEGNAWDVDDVDLAACDAEYDAYFGFEAEPNAQPGIGSLRHLTKLTDLKIPKHALIGNMETADVDWRRAGIANDKHMSPPCLSELLPDSLETLSVKVGSRWVHRDEAEKFLSDPRAESLKHLEVVGCASDHWISKTVEGGISPSKGVWRRKRNDGDAPV